MSSIYRPLVFVSAVFRCLLVHQHVGNRRSGGCKPRVKKTQIIVFKTRKKSGDIKIKTRNNQRLRSAGNNDRRSKRCCSIAVLCVCVMAHLHLNEQSLICDMWLNKIAYLLTYLLRDCAIIIRRGAEKLELYSKNLDSTPPLKQKN